jgi:hypothetical protein
MMRRFDSSVHLKPLYDLVTALHAKRPPGMGGKLPDDGFFTISNIFSETKQTG